LFALLFLSFCNVLFSFTVTILLHQDPSNRGRNEISFQAPGGVFYCLLPKMKTKIQEPQALHRPVCVRVCVCVFETESKHSRPLRHTSSSSVTVVTRLQSGWSKNLDSTSCRYLFFLSPKYSDRHWSLPSLLLKMGLAGGGGVVLPLGVK
jgi:hypothetical protein